MGITQKSEHHLQNLAEFEKNHEIFTLQQEIS